MKKAKETKNVWEPTFIGRTSSNDSEQKFRGKSFGELSEKELKAYPIYSGPKTLGDVSEKELRAHPGWYI